MRSLTQYVLFYTESFMITFDILTIFPEMFPGYFNSSILGRAQKNKKIKIRVHNLRDYTKDKHKITDDAAYGGIPGMVMKVEPIYEGVRVVKKMAPLKVKGKTARKRVILLSAKGKVLTQKKVRELSRYDQLIFIAGHYKGVDERVAKHIADEELSIGEYVITGGEVPAMLVVDAVSRMIPGVIGRESSKEGESFSTGVKYEHPVYTRPAVFSPSNKGMRSTQRAGGAGGKSRGGKSKGKKVEWKVPEVLLSGDHKKIEEWRRAERDCNSA